MEKLIQQYLDKQNACNWLNNFNPHTNKLEDNNLNNKYYEIGR